MGNYVCMYVTLSQKVMFGVVVQGQIVRSVSELNYLKFLNSKTMMKQFICLDCSCNQELYNIKKFSYEMEFNTT